MSQTFHNWTAVIRAAGQGTRMRSSLPKVLHPLAGRPMAGHVAHAARDAGFRRHLTKPVDTERLAQLLAEFGPAKTPNA